MRDTPKIMSLAAALAALSSPAVASQIRDPGESDGIQIRTASEEGIRIAAEPKIPGDIELMSFTVHQTRDGVMFPKHGSHSSHSSHSSHASHVSSSPGFGIPSLPNPVYVPPAYTPPAYTPPVYTPPAYVPPVYGPPLVAPPVIAPPVIAPPVIAPRAIAPPLDSGPVSDSDVAYVACTRARSGFGVNEIAGELGRLYGMSEEAGVSIARQALTSVLAGEDYCDSYHGDEQ